MTDTQTDPGILPQETLYLIDGSGFIFRAYHAMPPLTAPDGTPVGAVLGFSNMLVKLLNDFQARHIAVVFDAARRNFRYDIYPEYKANRAETPEDLIPQFPLIREATQAFSVPAVEQEGFEADDLIAAYALKARSEGYEVVIVGSDKDLYQLIREGVTMYDPMKSAFVGLADVVEKFGVAPERVIDVQALAGDSTDNIPGVPGIGVKTAAQLIGEYGSLDALLERAGEIKQPKRREALILHADAARLSRRLVTLDENAPLPVPVETLEATNPDTPQRVAFLQKMGFKSLLARLGKQESVGVPVRVDDFQVPKPPDSAFPPASANRYTLITDAAMLRLWADVARERGVLAVDTETTGLTPAKAALVGISLCSEIGQAAYIPLGHGGGENTDLFGDAPNPEDSGTPHGAQMPISEVMEILKPVLEDPSVLKIGHNIKFDMQMFAAHGVDVCPVDDTMLMSYVLDGTAHGHGMDELSERLCGHKTITYDEMTGTGKKRISFAQVPIDKALDYAAEDAEITFRLHKILKPRLTREHVLRVYEDIERPIIPVIARMERAGVRIDPAVLKALSADFGVRLQVLENEIHALAGHPFNVASPRQVGVVLFDEMGLQGGKKTRTGDWSTSADILESLAEQGHKVVEKILDWRQLAKLRSTYTEALLAEINPATGRVHTSFSMALTNTGRLSSSDPNVQNIPIRTEEGRKIRAAFVAEPGWKILSVDYSQVELRLAAALAGVEALKTAFQNNVDIHALTASQVFDVPIESVTSDQRRQAKTINFGIIYGISGFGLARQLGCDVGAANAFIRTYLARFPELGGYMEARREEARKYGFVKTLYGRKCVIGGIHSKNQAERAFAERQAINAPLQGAAADIMKLAMGRMAGALKEAGLLARMLLQVHDELVFEVPEDEIEQTAALARSVMQSSADIGVPLLAEAGWGDNWAAAH
ncbi:MAG: DNA polymerase I [Rhodospirillales bacterium]|nr:DNA polymerase I [Rhodospirillales bacterium]